MKKLALITVFYLLLTSSSCDKNPFVEMVYRIKFRNNTNSDLSYGLSYRYPDTIPFKEMLISTIRPNDYSTEDSWNKWEDEINKIPGKKLQIFVFSVSKISPQWNWDSVITKYQVLKRFELSSQQLKDMNYTVSYP